MEERVCPHCGLTSAVNDEGKCPLCGGDVTAVPEEAALETEAPSATVPGEPLPAVTEMQPPAVPAAPPPAVPPVAPPAPPPMPTPTAELVDGQIRCPHCGEALYAGEQVCWSCGKRVDDPVAGTEAAAAPVDTPQAPPVGLAPPALEPVTAAPEPPPELGWDELPRAEDKPAPSAEAMRLSYWSLGLGLAALLTCGALSILAPIVFMVVVAVVVIMIIGMMVGSTQALAPLSVWFA